MNNNNEFVLPYEPLTHDLIGFPAEKRRHIIARAALLNELRFDAKLNDVFHAVSEEIGLHAFRQATIEAKVELALTVGVEPELVFKTKKWPKIKTKKKRGDVLKAGSRFLQTFNDFGQELESRAPNGSQRLLRLTRDEWNLPFACPPISHRCYTSYVSSISCSHQSEHLCQLPNLSVVIRLPIGLRLFNLRRLMT